MKQRERESLVALRYIDFNASITNYMLNTPTFSPITLYSPVLRVTTAFLTPSRCTPLFFFLGRRRPLAGLVAEDTASAVDAAVPKRSTRFWGAEQDSDAPAQWGAGVGVAGVDGSQGLVSLYFFFFFILFSFHFNVIFPPLSHESVNLSLQNS